MRRFITYMYEYERGIRGRNVGFVRTDLRENNCRMELQIRGFERFRGKCPVYLTVYDQGLLAIPVAELLLTQGMGSCSFSCPNNQISDSTFKIQQAQTLTVSCGNGRFLTGCLNGTPVSEAFRGDFQIYEKMSPTPLFVMPSTDDQNTADGSSEPPTDEQNATDGSSEPPTDEQNATDISSEIPPDNSKTAIDPQPEPLNTASVDEIPEVSYKKIEITDIRRLPKKNWNLCNNRFLIHGFFNYHYLMLKTIERNGEKSMFLGVPGIYEQPERMMALLFGFPEFDAAAASSPSQSQDMSGVFGYWMCPLTSGPEG